MNRNKFWKDAMETMKLRRQGIIVMNRFTAAGARHGKVRQPQSRILFGTAFLCLIFVFANAIAQQPASKPNWSPLRFLLGTWIGEGSGNPGQGIGSFTFAFDLDERILIRRNHTEYPETKDRPGFSHDDLMIVYPAHNKSFQAVYFDNEGHSINYNVEISSGGDTVTFVSTLLPASPRFRLTYIKKALNSLLIRFEITPPAKPNEFSKYLEGMAHRVKPIPAIKPGESLK